MRCPTVDQLPPSPQGKIGWPWTEDTEQLPPTRIDRKPWPRVSVITPSYNQGQFIEETIRSVLLQGYPDLEYIVIDGGSTDESLEIIRRYERWLSYWVSERDRSQTHAINKGWTRATGEILAYINTDDCYLHGAIATAAQEFSLKPHVGMVYGSAIVVDEAGNQLRIWAALPFDLKIMLTRGSIIPQPAAFFSKAAVKTLGLLSEKWQMIMDYEYCTRMGMNFSTVCLAGTIARFRDHPQSKSRLRFETMAKELIEFLMTFDAHRLATNDWLRMKHAAMSRVHYELALAYLAQEQPEEYRALNHLLKSISLYPGFALAKPMITAHIVKRVLLAHSIGIGSQVTDLLKRMSS